MSAPVKFNCRYPLWLLLIALAVPTMNTYFAIVQLVTEGFGWSILSVVSATFIAALFAFGIRNRRRPVVEIGCDFITSGSVLQAIRWQARLSDVVEIMPSSPGKVVLRMRSGRKRRISLFEVALADRDAARQAIGDAVARSLE
ncbi:MAG: hypothetical protein VCE43_22865 [Myxococcota bacterium]|jgi:hypothetical protein